MISLLILTLFRKYREMENRMKSVCFQRHNHAYILIFFLLDVPCVHTPIFPNGHHNILIACKMQFLFNAM